ncbi:response regulator [Reichenbachiella agariperforans]|uniref:response regulator n=1 Tax=Reichenbachiella agariperforans TaxID=156994 RepID=UPI001C0931E8|nr:response regulator [Reichenbachiella agariperforans]MBU2914281.1 response regulator [Reichenbachiella agariperforans]
MGKIRKVAVIDDDQVFQLIIKKQIEMKNFECEILSFFNGQEAYDFFKENVDQSDVLPDLVMLDVNMPVKNGWDFLQDYQTLPSEMRSKIKLYMVTSSVIQSDIDKANDNENIISFVSKPITNEKLEEVFS